MKQKIHIYLFLSLLSFVASAAESVRIDTDFDNFTINGTTNTTVTINFDKPTEQPVEEAKAVKVYVPMENLVVGENSSRFYLYNQSGTTQIFDTIATTKVVNFPLRVFVGASDFYLYAAVYNADSSDTLKWEIARIYPTTLKSLDNSPITFGVSPADICLRVACTGLLPAQSAKVTKIFKVYFFVSTNNYIKGTPVDITNSSLNHGVFFSVGLSNRFYSESEFTGTITNVRRGDGRLFLEYTSPGILEPLNTRVLSHPNPLPPTHHNLPIGGTTADGAVFSTSTLLPETYAYSQNGELNVRNLNNDTDYNFSFVMVNKYLFATPVTVDAAGSPEAIEELLKKNSCFLLTAGFGEDHYIINYFRHFRDNVLLKNYFGKKFVGVYYELAPKYALMIYENEAIRSVIRGAAYILYFAFTHIYLMLLGALLIPIYFVVIYTLRKIKTVNQ